MSRRYTVRPSVPLRLPARVAKIEPVGASVTVTGPDIAPILVTDQEIFDAESAAGLTVVSEGTAKISVTYADEVDGERNPRDGEPDRGNLGDGAPEAVRGSSTAGTSGGLESRTVDELRKEAAEKKIKGRSKMDKDELIAAIRALD